MILIVNIVSLLEEKTEENYENLKYIKKNLFQMKQQQTKTNYNLF